MGARDNLERGGWRISNGTGLTGGGAEKPRCSPDEAPIMHTTLVEVTTRENFLRAQNITARFLDTIYFPFSIQTHLEGSFPESPIRLFCYPSLSAPKYFFMYKDNVYIKPYLMMAQIPGTNMDRLELVDCIREFRRRVFGATRRPHLVVGKDLLIKMYNVVMRIESCHWEAKDLLLSLFFMTESQRKASLKVALPNLPAGYYFDEIEPADEAELVNSTWKHAGPGDLEQTLAKLSRLPSSCVRYRGTPVAFEMMDPSGFFNNQYVFEDHRRKGLGNAVEIDLIQKSIKCGMNPFKTVSRDNKIVLDASVASPLWTQWKCEEGKPVTINFQEWSYKY
ncbi:unnamed protein product [Caenorhabditis auriculariae]|uniref:Glycine N-acyltransferase-like protein n=1 Tax=Caenorhabditis auriculariae TaxID=2777116 RepID=A0A8S1GQF7_9PELO|nr:unnamed protein product [Caenorhabditis auriculariae]